VWKLFSEKAVLWPVSFFLAHGFRVGFHEMKAEDVIVTGYGVPHSGFNAGTHLASAWNIACTGWLVHAIEHAAHRRGKIGMLFPFEKLLVLSALKLADGKRWCGDARSYEKCDPAEFRTDLRVMTSYLTEYLECVLEYVSRNSHSAWKGKKPTVLDLQAAPQGAQQFVRDNAIKRVGQPLVLPNENKGTATENSVDDAACPRCVMVVWLSVFVCPACIEQLRDGSGPRAPICCWRCAPAMYDDLHYKPEQADGRQPLLVGCHSPLVRQRLYNGRAYLLADKWKRVVAKRSD